MTVFSPVPERNSSPAPQLDAKFSADSPPHEDRWMVEEAAAPYIKVVVGRELNELAGRLSQYLTDLLRGKRQL